MTPNRPLALLDLDGILVDNELFEASVTRYIQNRIAEFKSVPVDRAVRLWEKSLSRERRSINWYDYDRHCLNVGIPNLSKEAHEQSIHQLRMVPGANDTWELLHERGCRFSGYMTTHSQVNVPPIFSG